MKISKNGDLTYEHDNDKSWDVSAYIIALYEKLKKWSYVYWRLWGVVNNLTCSRLIKSYKYSRLK